MKNIPVFLIGFGVSLGLLCLDGKAQTPDDLTLYFTYSTSDPDFDDWLAAAKEATGLEIGYVDVPTDSDTRHQKVMTALSSGDSSIDIFFINDEMSTTLKNTGWLERLNETVMTDELLPYFDRGYIQDMITSNDGDIIGVPSYKGALSMWVNQKILDQTGMETIDTQADFEEFCERCSRLGVYGYGGSWEKTYVHNEIAQFVAMFDGDYLDWTNENNRKALEFMKKMKDNGWTPVDQLADKYEQMTQKFIDGKYGIVFKWGVGGDFRDSGLLGSDDIHMIEMPLFEKKAVLADSWCFALNAASRHKEEGVRFLQWAASIDGEKAALEYFDNFPARSDAIMELVPEQDEARLMYETYDAEYEVSGRPMLPQAMDFISAMGTLFQLYIEDQISIDEFCLEAQKEVTRNSVERIY